MSRNYKFHNKAGLYFASFATVNWVDVFTRQVYFNVLVESINYCRREKVIKQKIDYIHNNPVERGFVTNAVDRKYSSVRNFQDNHTVLEIDYIGFLG